MKILFERFRLDRKRLNYFCQSSSSKILVLGAIDNFYYYYY